jgi:hypothetical protein
MALVMKITASWDVISRSLIDVYRHFGPYCGSSMFLRNVGKHYQIARRHILPLSASKILITDM